MPTILDIRDAVDIRDPIHRVVQALVEGRVVGLPTDTVYGMAASALCEDAVEAMFDLKGRDPSVPMAISTASREAAGDFVCHWSPLARRFATRLWPGPVTLVLPCDCKFSAVRQFPESVQERVVGEAGYVGFRVIRNRVLDHLHRLVSAPIVLTSANPSGQPSPTTAEEVAQSFESADPARFPLLIDDGPTGYGKASSVIRVKDRQFEILRSGAMDTVAMQKLAKPLVALICTGNTCRSPMAEALFREIVRQHCGQEDRVGVVSAGLAAADGMGAAPQAVEVVGKKNLDLTGHQSRALDDEIMMNADLVLTMTGGHRRAILAAWPTMADRVFTLRHDGGDVSDPVGMPVDVYQSCMEQMETELKGWVEKYADEWNLDGETELRPDSEGGQ